MLWLCGDPLRAPKRRGSGSGEGGREQKHPLLVELGGSVLQWEGEDTGFAAQSPPVWGSLQRALEQMAPGVSPTNTATPL